MSAADWMGRLAQMFAPIHAELAAALLTAGALLPIAQLKLRPPNQKKKLARSTPSEFHFFAARLVPITFCTVLLSTGVSSFIQSFNGMLSPFFQSWGLPLAQIFVASSGLWVLGHSDKKKT